MSTSSLPAQEPDNQGNQNLHLTDSLLVFGFGSERLTAKSYGSTPFFAAARSPEFDTKRRKLLIHIQRRSQIATTTG